MYLPRSLSKDRLAGSTLHATNSMTSKPPSDMRLNFSNSSTIVTDVDEHKVSATVPVKKISRTNTEKVNKIGKPDETKTSQRKPANNDNNNQSNTSAIRRPSVTVVRGRKVSNLDETEEPSLNTTRQETSSAISTVSKKDIQVNVTKLPQIKSTKIQRPRAASVGNISAIHVDKSSIKMQTLTNRATASMIVANRKANRGKGVTVKNLPKKLTATQSHHT